MRPNKYADFDNLLNDLDVQRKEIAVSIYTAFNAKTTAEKQNSLECLKNYIENKDIRFLLEVGKHDTFLSAILLRAYVDLNNNLEFYNEMFAQVMELLVDKLLLNVTNEVFIEQLLNNRTTDGFLFLKYFLVEQQESRSALIKLLQKKNEETLDIIQWQCSKGLCKGQSVLWVLAIIAKNGHPEALMAVMPQLLKLDSNLLISVLQATAEEEDHGKSVLWLFAFLVTCGYPQTFMAVLPQLQKLNASLLFNALQAIAQTGTTKGQSVLWLLADAAAIGLPEALMGVLPQLLKIDQASLFMALQVSAVEGVNHAGNSVLDLILFAAKQSHISSQTLDNIFAKVPDLRKSI